MDTWRCVPSFARGKACGQRFGLCPLTGLGLQRSTSSKGKVKPLRLTTFPSIGGTNDPTTTGTKQSMKQALIFQQNFTPLAPIVNQMALLGTSAGLQSIR